MFVAITVTLFLLSCAVIGLSILAYDLSNRIDALENPPKKQTGRQKALTDDDMIEIEGLINEGVSKTDIAKAFNISRQTLYTYLNQAGMI